MIILVCMICFLAGAAAMWFLIKKGQVKSPKTS